MPQAATLLFDQARTTREQAARARRLARAVIAQDVVEQLSDLAGELEARAAVFEQEAQRLLALAPELSGHPMPRS